MNAWPFPNDTVLERARRVAQAYREHLNTVAPELCGTVDKTMLAFGQTWVLPMEDNYKSGDAISTSEAAELVGVSRNVIRQWACMKHRFEDRPLLPRLRRRGREMTYLVDSVREAARIMDHYHGTRASSV